VGADDDGPIEGAIDKSERRIYGAAANGYITDIQGRDSNLWWCTATGSDRCGVGYVLWNYKKWTQPGRSFEPGKAVKAVSNRVSFEVRAIRTRDDGRDFVMVVSGNGIRSRTGESSEYESLANGANDCYPGWRSDDVLCQGAVMAMISDHRSHGSDYAQGKLARPYLTPSMAGFAQEPHSRVMLAKK